MERQLRLGDILDDYCPRERRVTNHAIVAMIDDRVKQTRCLTCDAEHVYKEAKVPPRRKKADGALLYEQVLAGKRPQPVTEPAAVESPVDAAAAPDQAPEPAPAPVAASPAAVDSDVTATAEEPVVEEGPVRRPLIRATLPRPEGQPSARPIPEFTIRQSSGRNGNFREPDRGTRNHRPHTGARPAPPSGGRAQSGRGARPQGRAARFPQNAGARPNRPQARQANPVPRQGKKGSR